MSIKELFENAEQVRINNENLSVAVEGKLNELILSVGEAQDEVNTSLNKLKNAMDELKKFLRKEFSERGDDIVRLMEGAA